MTDQKTVEEELEAVKRKNAELLGEVKGLKAKIAGLEEERDAAAGRADKAEATMGKVLLEDPIERGIAPRFVVPWRVMRPLIAEHFDFALNDEGKPMATTKGETPETLDLEGVLTAMQAIPDLAASMRLPQGDGAKGSRSDQTGRTPPAQQEPARQTARFGLR